MTLRGGMAARMVTEATLRSLGGCSVTVSGAVAEEDAGATGLGIGAPMRQEWELEPVVVRWKTATDENHRELLVSAETLERAFGTCDSEVLRTKLLRSRLELGDETLRVAEVSTEMCEGTVYLYRMRVER